MDAVAWFTAGGVLGICFLYAARHNDRQRERKALAVGLLVAALIYVVAAALDRNVSAMVWEGLGVVLFGTLAAIGLRRWPMLLALGWATHIGWDAGLHLALPQKHIGTWYPLLCIGFDPIVAGYAGWRARPSNRTAYASRTTVPNRPTRTRESDS